MSRLFDFSQNIDPEFIEKNSGAVSAKNIEEVKERTEAILTMFAKKSSLRKFMREAVLLVSLIRDYASGRYNAVPWWAISAAVFTMLYVFNPLDLMPDALPIVGLLDDATVVTACLAMVSRELSAYQKWKIGISKSTGESPA